MDLTLLERRIVAAIKVDSFFVSFDSLSKTLLHYAEPLVFSNSEYPEYPISRIGSAFKVRQGQKYFMFLSEHQMVGRNPQDVVILNRRNNHLVSSHSSIYCSNFEDGEVETDLRLLEFTDAVLSGLIVGHMWFPIEDAGNWHDAEILMSVAVGFPYLGRPIDYGSKDIKMTPRAVFGRFVGKTLSYREGFELITPIAYDPDGFSGAPVFHICEKSGQFGVIAAGIVVNAGMSMFNYVPISYLLGFLQHRQT
jgi:hypothetical protein